MPVPPPTPDEVEREVAAILADPARASRYDLDGDGVVDGVERALLAQVVASELHTARIRAAGGASTGMSVHGVVAGRFELVRVLGEGGQGTTYLATDRERGVEVALKRLRLAHAADWKAIELFEREGQVLAQLDHPAIPRYLAAFDVDEGDPLGGLYIAQEYVAGEPLGVELARGRRYDEAEVRATLREVLTVLVYLHRLNPPVVHRDIKPSNLIRRTDGRLALIDFGAIGAALPAAARAGSTIIGTSGYMAPEQFMGRAVPATDLYALGATAVHLLTHHHPADLPLERMRLRWRDVAPGVSAALADFIDRLLSPAPEDRFPSAQEALTALDAVDRPAPPRPASPPTQAAPRHGRARRGLLIAGIAGLVGAGAVGAALDGYSTERAATNRTAFASYDVPVTVAVGDDGAGLEASVWGSSVRGSFYRVEGHVTNGADRAVTELKGRVRLYDGDDLVGAGDVDAWPRYRPALLPGQRSPLAGSVRVAGRVGRAEVTFDTVVTAAPVAAGEVPVPLLWDTTPVVDGALAARERAFGPTRSDAGRDGLRTWEWEVEVENVGAAPLAFVKVEARVVDGAGQRVTHDTYVTGSAPMQPGSVTPVRLRVKLAGEPHARELAVINASAARAGDL